MGSTHWTSKEVRKLKKLFRDGLTDAQMAKEIGRPETGVKGKRVELGLHRRGTKRKPMRKRRRRPDPVPAIGNGVAVDEEHPYAVVVRGPNRELAMAVDADTGLAVLQLMLGVSD
jgi:hypothetical protein